MRDDKTITVQCVANCKEFNNALHELAGYVGEFPALVQKLTSDYDLLFRVEDSEVEDEDRIVIKIVPTEFFLQSLETMRTLVGRSQHHG